MMPGHIIYQIQSLEEYKVQNVGWEDVKAIKSISDVCLLLLCSVCSFH